MVAHNIDRREWSGQSDPCSWIQQRLPIFLDGELTLEESRRVGRHLDGCVRCQRAKFEQEQLLVSTLEALVPEEPSLALFASLRDTLERVPVSAVDLYMPTDGSVGASAVGASEENSDPVSAPSAPRGRFAPPTFSPFLGGPVAALNAAAAVLLVFAVWWTLPSGDVPRIPLGSSAANPGVEVARAPHAAAHTARVTEPELWSHRAATDLVATSGEESDADSMSRMLRGDLDGDGVCNVNDVVISADLLQNPDSKASAYLCMAAGDMDDDGDLDIQDYAQTARLAVDAQGPGQQWLQPVTRGHALPCLLASTCP